AEDRGRSDQPKPEQDLGTLLPALQRSIFELSKAKHEDADSERIEDHKAALALDHVMVRLVREPWRYDDQKAKQHAEPVFPCSMGTQKSKVRHCRPPCKRGIRQRPAGITLRCSGDRSGRIGRTSEQDVGTSSALARAAGNNLAEQPKPNDRIDDMTG